MTIAERTRGHVKATVLDAAALRRSLTRIAHEITERNRGAEDLVLAGVISRGDVLAHRLAAQLERLEGHSIPVLELDVSAHRDDRAPNFARKGHISSPETALFVRKRELVEGRTVVIVDDVLHHGRTARAAMEAVLDYGRPARVQLAVLVDRGHRELPIRPDYVGKNVPTAEEEHVEVQVQELDGSDGAVILGD